LPHKWLYQKYRHKTTRVGKQKFSPTSSPLSGGNNRTGCINCQRIRSANSCIHTSASQSIALQVSGKASLDTVQPLLSMAFPMAPVLTVVHVAFLCKNTCLLCRSNAGLTPGNHQDRASYRGRRFFFASACQRNRNRKSPDVHAA